MLNNSLNVWQISSVHKRSKLVLILKWIAALRKNLQLIALCAWQQGLTNTGRQVALASKFCTVAHTVCGSSVWNVFNISFSGA
jgi:hypothetical protein